MDNKVTTKVVTTGNSPKIIFLCLFLPSKLAHEDNLEEKRKRKMNFWGSDYLCILLFTLPPLNLSSGRPKLGAAISAKHQ